MHSPTFLMRSNAQNTYELQMHQEMIQFNSGEVLVRQTLKTLYTPLLLTTLRVYTVFTCLQKQAQSLYHKKGFQVSDKHSAFSNAQQTLYFSLRNGFQLKLQVIFKILFKSKIKEIYWYCMRQCIHNAEKCKLFNQTYRILSTGKARETWCYFDLH